MYHSWGSQNAWLRQIHTRAPLYVPGPVWAALGFADGDWACVDLRARPHHRRGRAQERRRQPATRCGRGTPSASARGAWALASDVPEARRGFLLNHLIGELLPPKADGRRWSNSDPITGQAAWYDLRVRLEKAEPGELSEPHFKAVEAPPGQAGRPAVLRYGEEWST